MKLRLRLTKSYGYFKIFEFHFLSFSRDLLFFLCLPETLLSLNKKNLPQIRQVMIISDMMFKMREKLHVWKYS